MELWIGSFSFNTIEVIVLLICGGIILHYLFKDNENDSKYNGLESSFAINDEIIAVNIIGIILDEIRRENIDIKEDKTLMEVMTKLSLDKKYRKNFIERNLKELLEASNSKDIEKIILLLRKEIL